MPNIVSYKHFFKGSLICENSSCKARKVAQIHLYFVVKITCPVKIRVVKIRRATCPLTISGATKYLRGPGPISFTVCQASDYIVNETINTRINRLAVIAGRQE